MMTFPSQEAAAARALPSGHVKGPQQHEPICGISWKNPSFHPPPPTSAFAPPSSGEKRGPSRATHGVQRRSGIALFREIGAAASAGRCFQDSGLAWGGVESAPSTARSPSWAFLRKEVVTGPETLWAAVRGQHKSPRFCLVATLPLRGLTPDPRSSLAPMGT